MTNAVIFDLLARDKSLSDTIGKASRSSQDAAGKMSSAFAGVSKSISAELDKIERAAFESGDGISSEFASALAVVRDDLGRINDVARRTGAGLDSELGGALRDVRRAMEQLRPAADEAGDAVKRSASHMDDAFESAAKKIERELDDIKQAAFESGRGMDREFTRALDSLRSDLQRVSGEAGRTGAKLESELGGALNDVREKAAKLKSQLDDVGDSGGGLGSSLTDAFSGGGLDVGGMIESLTGGAGGGIATAGAAVGAAIAEAELKAFEAFFEQRQIGGLIAAQQGASVTQAGRLGRISGEAYYAGFADSVEEGGAALSSVLSQGLINTDATQEDLQKLTNAAAVASKVVGDDVNEIARGANQLLKTGLAKNAQEAMDLITAASVHGANQAGDLMDTIEEYSIQFEKMGLSGQESLGLITQALGAGARNADIAADAIKEFAIRSIDGSAATSRGFRTLGLDAGKMASDLGAGGDRARAALDQTLDALRAIPDPVKRSQAAVDLFGTKAEDLGNALYAMDLDTVSKQLGDVSGATDKAGATMEASLSPIDKTGRGFENMANQALGAMYAVLGLNDATDGGQGHYEKSKGAVDALKSSEEKHVEAQQRVRDAVSEAAAANNIYISTLDEIIQREHTMAGQTEDLGRAQIGYQQAIDAANQAIKDNGQNIDITTKAGQDNVSTLYDLSDATWSQVQAMEAASAGTEEVRGFMATARDQFINTAISMGYSRDQANQLADQLHLIPGEYTATAKVNTNQANTALATLREQIKNTIYDRVMQIKLEATGGWWSFGGHRAGGGDVEAGKGYVVGEKGQEFFIPDQDGKIIPNDVLMASAASIRPTSIGSSRSAGSGTPVVVLEWGGGPSDELGAAAFNYFRKTIKDRHGGSVVNALNQRGVG